MFCCSKSLLANSNSDSRTFPAASGGVGPVLTNHAFRLANANTRVDALTAYLLGMMGGIGGVFTLMKEQDLEGGLSQGFYFNFTYAATAAILRKWSKFGPVIDREHANRTRQHQVSLASPGGRQTVHTLEPEAQAQAGWNAVMSLFDFDYVSPLVAVSTQLHPVVEHYDYQWSSEATLECDLTAAAMRAVIQCATERTCFLAEQWSMIGAVAQRNAPSISKAIYVNGMFEDGVEGSRERVFLWIHKWVDSEYNAHMIGAGQTTAETAPPASSDAFLKAFDPTAQFGLRNLSFESVCGMLLHPIMFYAPIAAHVRPQWLYHVLRAIAEPFSNGVGLPDLAGFLGGQAFHFWPGSPPVLGTLAFWAAIPPLLVIEDMPVGGPDLGLRGPRGNLHWRPHPHAVTRLVDAIRRITYGQRNQRRGGVLDSHFSVMKSQLFMIQGCYISPQFQAIYSLLWVPAQTLQLPMFESEDQNMGSLARAYSSRAVSPQQVMRSLLTDMVQLYEDLVSIGKYERQQLDSDQPPSQDQVPIRRGRPLTDPYFVQNPVFLGGRFSIGNGEMVDEYDFIRSYLERYEVVDGQGRVHLHRVDGCGYRQPQMVEDALVLPTSCVNIQAPSPYYGGYHPVTIGMPFVPAVGNIMNRGPSATTLDTPGLANTIPTAHLGGGSYFVASDMHQIEDDPAEGLAVYEDARLRGFPDTVTAEERRARRDERIARADDAAATEANEKKQLQGTRKRRLPRRSNANHKHPQYTKDPPTAVPGDHPTAEPCTGEVLYWKRRPRVLFLCDVDIYGSDSYDVGYLFNVRSKQFLRFGGRDVNEGHQLHLLDPSLGIKLAQLMLHSNEYACGSLHLRLGQHAPMFTEPLLEVCSDPLLYHSVQAWTSLQREIQAALHKRFAGTEPCAVHERLATLSNNQFITGFNIGLPTTHGYGVHLVGCFVPSWGGVGCPEKALELVPAPVQPAALEHRTKQDFHIFLRGVMRWVPHPGAHPPHAVVHETQVFTHVLAADAADQFLQVPQAVCPSVGGLPGDHMCPNAQLRLFPEVLLPDIERPHLQNAQRDCYLLERIPPIVAAQHGHAPMVLNPLAPVLGNQMIANGAPVVQPFQMLDVLWDFLDSRATLYVDRAMRNDLARLLAQWMPSSNLPAAACLPDPRLRDTISGADPSIKTVLMDFQRVALEDSVFAPSLMTGSKEAMDRLPRVYARECLQPVASHVYVEHRSYRLNWQELIRELSGGKHKLEAAKEPTTEQVV